MTLTLQVIWFHREWEHKQETTNGIKPTFQKSYIGKTITQASQQHTSASLQAEVG